MSPDKQNFPSRMMAVLQALQARIPQPVTARASELKAQFLAAGKSTQYAIGGGSAVFMLLLAKLMLDTQRHYMLETPVAHMSEWRLVFAVWAYMIIVMSMWMVISPWRMRDMMEWMLAKPRRLAAKGWFRLVFGILLIVLGLTVFGIPDTAPE